LKEKNLPTLFENYCWVSIFNQWQLCNKNNILPKRNQ